MSLASFLARAAADCTGVMAVDDAVREVLEYRDEHDMHRLPPGPLVTAWTVATATDISAESRELLVAGLTEALAEVSA